MSMGVRSIRGLTPRGQGHTGPRSNAVSGSTGPRGRGTTTPRGVTPSARHRSQTSSSSSDDGIEWIAPGIPKINFTCEEELDILERLETGNYVKGGGLVQFLPNRQGNPGAAVNKPVEEKPKYRQNLNGAFASLDNNQKQQTKNTGKKRFDLDDPGFSFPSVLSQEDTDRLTLKGLGKVDEEVVNSSVEDASMEEDDVSGKSQEGDGYKLPVHCKKVDEIIQAMDDYRILIEQTVEAVFEARFAEIFPQNMVQSIKKMEKAMKVLGNFLNENTSENMKLFFPSPKKKAILPCPIEEQEEFINTMYKLSELLVKYQRYLNSENNEINLEAKVQLFADAVEKLEKDLKDGEDGMTAVEELLKMSKELSRNSEGSSADSSEFELFDSKPSNSTSN